MAWVKLFNLQLWGIESVCQLCLSTNNYHRVTRCWCGGWHNNTGPVLSHRLMIHLAVKISKNFWCLRLVCIVLFIYYHTIIILIIIIIIKICWQCKAEREWFTILHSIHPIILKILAPQYQPIGCMWTRPIYRVCCKWMPDNPRNTLLMFKVDGALSTNTLISSILEWSND